MAALINTRRSGSCAALMWGLGFFAALQLVLNVALDYWRPELRDPEYTCKLSRLRKKLADNSEKPLFLVLGSSRVQMGFRPDRLTPCRTPNGAEALVFNFGCSGSGPITDLLRLRQLLADGIRPTRVFCEVLPAYFSVGNGELNILGGQVLACKDLPRVYRYHAEPWLLIARWLRMRSVPCYSHRGPALSWYLPSWCDETERRNDPWHLNQRHDDWGWLPYPEESITPEGYRTALAKTQTLYADLLAHFHVKKTEDRAIRDLLALCRERGIDVTLFLTPESGDFRKLYPAGVRESFDAYLAGVVKEYAVPLIDARAWVPDADFWDGHHLLPGGATRFTERFDREVLQRRY